MSRAHIVLVGLAMFVVASLSLARGEDKPASQPAKSMPIDFHKLQELMPADAVGVKRSSLNGENMSIGENTITNAKADYTKPESDGSDAHGSIEISDYSGAP